MDRQFDVLYGYLALARRPGQTAEVDDRTRLLVPRARGRAERLPVVHRPGAA